MSDSASGSISSTDWDRVDRLTDEEIDTSDIPPLTDEFFRRASVRWPPTVPGTIDVDPDVLAWFTSQGDDGVQRMSAALRIYADAHRRT